MRWVAIYRQTICNLRSFALFCTRNQLRTMTELHTKIEDIEDGIEKIFWEYVFYFKTSSKRNKPQSSRVFSCCPSNSVGNEAGFAEAYRKMFSVLT